MNSKIILCLDNFKNNKDCSECLKKRREKLKIDKVKEHTLMKVKLVTSYAEKWIEKGVFSNITELNFIDSMSNAGFYISKLDNKEFDTTAINVFKIKKKRNVSPLTLIYVDPYNYAMVDNKKLINFINSTYSELIFNYMKMDVQKNINNETAKKKQIDKSIVDLGYSEYIENVKKNVDELLRKILERLENTKFKKYMDFD